MELDLSFAPASAYGDVGRSLASGPDPAQTDGDIVATTPPPVTETGVAFIDAIIGKFIDQEGFVR